MDRKIETMRVNFKFLISTFQVYGRKGGSFQPIARSWISPNPYTFIVVTKLFISLFSVIAGLFGWVISFTSIFKTGLGWDSVFDLSAAKVSIENSGLQDLNTYYDSIPLTSEFYGTFVYKIADWFSIQLTNSSIFEDTLALSNYYFVGVTTWFISLFSIILVCSALYIAFESKKYALYFFGLVSTLPIWVGMSQVNSKDIPVAAGISILSAGFMLILKKYAFRKLFWIGILYITIGNGISIAVRPASVLLVITFLLLNTLIFVLFNLNKRNFILILRDIFIIYFISLPISVYIIYLSNTISISNLFSWVIDAFRFPLDYPSIQPIRLFGQDFLSNELPPWYIFAWVWAQLPTLTFLSLFLGICILAKRALLDKNLDLIYPVSPFLIQALLIPFSFMILQPNMYNGVRHILFIYPALILIAVIFLVNIMEIPNSKFITLIVHIFTALVFFLNIFSTFRWAPYSYAFINPVAGMSEQRNWDLDYWGLSAREGIERLKEIDPSGSVFVMPDNSSSAPFGGQSVTELTYTTSPYSLYVFVHWNHKIVEEGCKIEFDIKRDNQILGMGGFCSK